MAQANPPTTAATTISGQPMKTAVATAIEETVPHASICRSSTTFATTANLICLPFLWQHGVMTPLPTLGGNNGQANEVNNRGQVVGLAENTTSDPTCPAPDLQVKPVVWEKGKVQELPTFPGDLDGFAAAINDNGLAVGASGSCFFVFQQATFTPCSGKMAHRPTSAVFGGRWPTLPQTKRPNSLRVLPTVRHCRGKKSNKRQDRRDYAVRQCVY